VGSLAVNGEEEVTQQCRILFSRCCHQPSAEYR
jgi:hypothetical protein